MIEGANCEGIKKDDDSDDEKARTVVHRDGISGTEDEESPKRLRCSYRAAKDNEYIAELKMRSRMLVASVVIVKGHFIMFHLDEC